MDVDQITSTLCYGDVAWEMTRVGAYKHFKIGVLTFEAKVWYSLVTSRLDPRKHVNEVTLERAKLVYAIMSRMTIDIGQFLRSKIMQTATTTATGSHLLSQLCVARQVW